MSQPPEMLPTVPAPAPTQTIADTVAYYQNGRAVTYREVTTEDLIANSTWHDCAESRAELARRGINWERHK